MQPDDSKFFLDRARPSSKLFFDQLAKIAPWDPASAASANTMPTIPEDSHQDEGWADHGVPMIEDCGGSSSSAVSDDGGGISEEAMRDTTEGKADRDDGPVTTPA